MEPFDPPPPKWVMRLVRFFCPPDFREEIEGDFWEKYQVDLQKHGPNVARKRSIAQLISIIRFNLLYNLNQPAMKSIFKVRENPFGLLLMTAIALLAAIAVTPVSNLEIQDKTLFRLEFATMIWMIPILLLLVWLLYLPTKKFLYSTTVTWIHVLLTVVTTLLIMAVVSIGIDPSPAVTDRHELIGNTLQMLTLLFIFGQFIYLANILLGVIVGKRATS